MSNVAGSSLAPGTTVAGYRIEALIGRGGMGAVYRADEEGLGRKVALKVIAPELAQDERFRERFLRESRIAASLDHPHVIPIYQAGEQDGVLFLAMRYVEGSDLAKARRRGRRARAEARRRPPLADRGGPRRRAREGAHPSRRQAVERPHRQSRQGASTATSETSASPSAPARSRESRSPARSSARSSTSRPSRSRATRMDERSDVYSLGCVVYECLTGPVALPSRDRRRAPVGARPRGADPAEQGSTGPSEGARHRPHPRARQGAGAQVPLGRRAPRRDAIRAPARRHGAGCFARRSRRNLAVAAAIALLACGGAARLRPDARLRRALDGLCQLRRRDRSRVEQARRRGACRHRSASDRHRSRRRLGHERRGRDRLAHRSRRIRRLAMRRSRWTAIRATSRSGAAPIWVALGALAELQRINPEQNEAASPTSALGDDTPCGAPRASIAFGGGYPRGSSARAARSDRSTRRTTVATTDRRGTGAVVELRASAVLGRRLRARLALDREQRAEQGRRGRSTDDAGAAVDHRRQDSERDRGR